MDSTFLIHPVNGAERRLTKEEFRQALETCVGQCSESDGRHGCVYLFRMRLAARGWNQEGLREFERLALLKLGLPRKKS